MAKERLKSPRARLFVALDLPESLRTGIAEWGRRELADPALRPVARESLHITLAFLGYLPEREIERLGQIIEGLGREAIPLSPRDPVARPSLARARLFALPVDSVRAVALQAELEEDLVAARLYKREERPFWPHVTVARVRATGRGAKRPARVERPPGRLPGELLQPALAVRIRLYRSELNPKGARYTPLAQVELPAGGQQ